MKTRIGVLCGCVSVLVLAALLPAKPGIVTTHDGQRYEGDVTEDGATVTVTSRKIPLVIQRNTVQSIEYLGTFDEQYAQRMAKLDPNDAAGRVAVGRWAFDQGHYPQARQALEAALAIEPNNREAQQMLESVRVQVRLERAKKDAAATAEARRAPATNPATTGATTQAAGAGASPSTAHIDPRHLLSADDINTIRQFELKPTDTHVRINFARDVKKRYASAENMRLQDFNARTLFDQLQAILQTGSADMKRDVRIVSDPSSILEYRRSVQPLILASCATSGCHGSAGAGGLMLYSPAENEAITYTNFFILQTYARPVGPQQGPFGGGEQRLIDRVEPANSLLLQYALPPTIAANDHPTVNGYRPIFRNRDDNGYRRVEDWIAQSLIAVKPDYGIDYAPPQRGGGGGAPATRPATTQAGG